MIDWTTLEPSFSRQNVKLQPINRWVWTSVYFVKTSKGTELELWKVLEADHHESFNCHGFTLKTHEAPNGPYWVQWSEMFKVLLESCAPITTGSDVLPGDVIVCGNEDRIEHTAIVRTPIYLGDGIADETRVDSKNGTRPPDLDVPIRQFHGEFEQCRRMFFRSRD
jgi:hypothetical protein